MPRRKLSLAAIRLAVRALPGVEEGTSYGTPAWRHKGKMLARLHQDGESIVLKVGNESVEVRQLDAERLVDLSRHNYRLEPNVTFTADGRWIVFRSNMHGASHVYAVEVAKAEKVN